MSFKGFFHWPGNQRMAPAKTLRVVLLLSLLLAGQAAAPAHAAGLVVNSLLDTIASDGNCTLREAITNANNNLATNPDCAAGSGADTITFSVSGMITLGSTLPGVFDAAGLTINGTGQMVTISGGGATEVAVVVGVPLTLDHLTIANGSSSNGGGIFSNGTLTIRNSTISGNTASSGDGGGIYNTGVLTVTNSTFTGNTASGNGGGIKSDSGPVTITNSTFSGNTAATWGGGFLSSSIATITNSTFSGNSASGGGGGAVALIGTAAVTLRNTIVASSTGGNCVLAGGTTLVNGGNNMDDGATCGWGSTNGSMSSTAPNLDKLGGNGGPTETFALLAGSPAIDGVTFSPPNSAPSTDQRGVARPQGLRYDIGAFELVEAIEVNSLLDTIGFDGNCTLREAIQNANNNAMTNADCGAGGGTDTITFSVSGTITLGSTLPTISDVAGAGLTMDGTGQALTISGGGLVRVLRVATPLSLDSLTIADGIAPDVGGGGGIFHTGALNIRNSVFSNNSTSSNFNGGGIGGSGGTLAISDSTFSGNSAPGGGIGGAIFDLVGAVTIANSSFSGNSAGQWGGGIFSDLGTLTITNSTFSGNSAGTAGGGVSNQNLSSTVALRNTIVANSTGGNCDGTITNGGNNIDDGTTCGWGSAGGSMSSTDPLLGSLANNGGPTRTFALLAGSPAIDAGDDVTCNAAPVSALDQRGIARPQGAHCDIGAYESLHLAISGNAGVGGATLTYGAGSTSADGSGKYWFTVPYDWSGTVIPSMPGYTFAPDHIDYPGVTTDQPSQDYTATMNVPPPLVAWVSPTHGSQACPLPHVGVELLLPGMAPAPWTLKLDGANVTGAAMMWELLMNPPLAITMYTPTTALDPGVHTAEFDYATAAGPQVLTWNFTVTNSLTCTPGSPSLAPPLDGSPPSSSQDVPSADRRVIDIP